MLGSHVVRLIPHCAEVVAVEFEFSDFETVGDAKNPARSYISFACFKQVQKCQKRSADIL